MDKVTTRQQRILDYIRETVRERGYPPTVREIGEAVGLTSSSSVHAQLSTLQRRGLLRRDATKPRAMELKRDRTAEPPSVAIPVVGRVAAGAPILAEENVEEYLAFPEGYAGSGEHFALHVAGDSMTGAGIFDGDVVIARRQERADDGDIVVAVLAGAAEDEATVKRLRRRDGRPMLVPENPAMEPFPLGDGRVAGKVVAALRRF